eukprot:IDg9399t1
MIFQAQTILQLIALVTQFLSNTATANCPNICHTDLTLAEEDCRNFPSCEVDTCRRGYVCKSRRSPCPAMCQPSWRLPKVVGSCRGRAKAFGCLVRKCRRAHAPGWTCDSLRSKCPNMCRRLRSRAVAECNRLHHFGCSVQRCYNGRHSCGSPRPCVATCIGDPHCTTFDGKKLNCGVGGEFLLAHSTRLPKFTLQGRFVQRTVRKRLVSFATAAVIQHQIQGRVQISKGHDTKCQIRLRVGGTVHAFPSPNSKLELLNGVVIASRFGSKIAEIRFFSGIRLRIHFSVCAINTIQLHVPSGVCTINRNHIWGLFGTPNGNLRDDLRTRRGRIWRIPGLSSLAVKIDRSPRDNRGSRFCSKNWCIRKAASSIFSYEDGTNFNTFQKCDKVPQGTSLSKEAESGFIVTSRACVAFRDSHLIAFRDTCARKFVRDFHLHGISQFSALSNRTASCEG